MPIQRHSLLKSASLWFVLMHMSSLPVWLPLAHLRTIVLDCFDPYEDNNQNLLHPNSLLSLPPSVTKLVLCRLDRFVPAVALPENIAVVYEESLLEYDSHLNRMK